MGRPNKVGLDYFELDCLLDDKCRLIQAEFGLKGFAVIVKLYQKIYGGQGYYCEWNDDVLLLFMSENGLTGDGKNLIDNIVSACIRRGIFSEELHTRYHILTSAGVQKRYLNAVSKREKVELKKEYLLIQIPKNMLNVSINEVSDGRNQINVAGNPQSRVEKSKEENKKNKSCRAEAVALFEHLWSLYPVKRGKGQISDTAKLQLLKIGREEMERAIDRYKAELEREKDWLHPKNGSTFFNSGYVDYLDANYVPRDKPQPKAIKQTGFHNFDERGTDYDKLVRQINGVG